MVTAFRFFAGGGVALALFCALEEKSSVGNFREAAGLRLGRGRPGRIGFIDFMPNGGAAAYGHCQRSSYPINKTRTLCNCVRRAPSEIRWPK
jgi:hypothetical protein